MLKALKKLLFGEQKKVPQAKEPRLPAADFTEVPRSRIREMLGLRRRLRATRPGSTGPSLASVKAKLPKSWFTKKRTPGRVRVYRDALASMSQEERDLLLAHAPREWMP